MPSNINALADALDDGVIALRRTIETDEVGVELDDEVLLGLCLEAHRRDVTLNRLLREILVRAADMVKANPDMTEERIGEALAEQDLRCPIGLDASPTVCSAGTCVACHDHASGMKIERFSPSADDGRYEDHNGRVHGDLTTSMESDPEGEWVRFEDHERVLAGLAI